MTRLLLIRHGQASFGSNNYDQLCPTGLEQANVTGRHLSKLGLTPDRAYTGPLQRQRETAHTALKACGYDSALQEDTGLEEYPARALFDSYLDHAAAEFPELNCGYEALLADQRLYSAGLRAVTQLWTEGAPGHEGETWLDFSARVRSSLDRVVISADPQDTVVIFTSGGVIGTAAAQAFGLPSKTDGALAMQFARATLNASITELNYGRSGYTLISFNCVYHLQVGGETRLVTKR